MEEKVIKFISARHKMRWSDCTHTDFHENQSSHARNIEIVRALANTNATQHSNNEYIAISNVIASHAGIPNITYLSVSARAYVCDSEQSYTLNSDQWCYATHTVKQASKSILDWRVAR